MVIALDQKQQRIQQSNLISLTIKRLKINNLLQIIYSCDK